MIFPNLSKNEVTQWAENDSKYSKDESEYEI